MGIMHGSNSKEKKKSTSLVISNGERPLGERCVRPPLWEKEAIEEDVLVS